MNANMNIFEITSGQQECGICWTDMSYHSITPSGSIFVTDPKTNDKETAAILLNLL